ncbi:unnamed protein product [Kuraishia capsulata CBS 1993]|uniref:Clathrin/coatomer adaptor adaptin-like N-terminal domain-containing protein n=1 Tax=Kuraishia capsulata CBS 1993 TaxID=1382522 RepID=W6MIR3_9ASCO|nr:uncharacterized protein KUCA_T00002007001 [Kuraishia capsulata CBS 1993]CDK26036.1 unnamed protein product [Kuraishia capsulata CBS 1993]
MTDSALARNISSMIESARDLTMDAISHTGQGTNFNPAAISDLINGKVYSSAFSSQSMPQLNETELLSYLNSSSEKEKLLALKYITRVSSRTNEGDLDVLQFFPHVVKNINSSNLTVKKLVFVYLLKYNHLEQDISLLSINAIQKSLSDKSPLIRSLAIRVICGIKIPAILPILMLSIKKTISDVSPLVRSSTAIAITKCFELDRVYNDHLSTDEALEDESSNVHNLFNNLAVLLSDDDAKVLGSAIVTFAQIFPGKYELLHSRYTHICHKIPELDDSAKALVIPLLTDYARLFVPKPKLLDRSNAESIIDSPNEMVDMPSFSHFSSLSFSEYDVIFHTDLSSLLGSVRDSVYSQSVSVVLAVARCLIALAPPKVIKDYKLDRALYRFTSSQDQDVAETALKIILLIISSYPAFLQNDQISQFFLLPNESHEIARLKLLIMAKLANNANFDVIFKEFKYTVESGVLDVEAKVLAVKCICKLCCSKAVNLDAKHTSKVLSWLLRTLDQFASVEESDGIPGSTDILVSEALTGVRYIIQQNLLQNTPVLLRLLAKLVPISDAAKSMTIHHPVTRASIIWLLGEFSNSWMQAQQGSDVRTADIPSAPVLDACLPDVLRILVTTFATESSICRLQILGFAAKLFTKDLYMHRQTYGDSLYQFDNIVFKLFSLTLHYAKYDPSLDVRDKARTLSYLLPNIFSGKYITTSSGLTSFEDFLSPETSPIAGEVIADMYAKLSEVDLAALMLQVSKNAPITENSLTSNSGDESNLDTRLKGELFSPLLIAFLEVPEWSDAIASDSSLQTYYEDLRKKESEVKSFNKIVNSISHKTVVNNPASFRSASSLSMPGTYEKSSVSTLAPVANAKKFKLQSLDEFFAESSQGPEDDDDDEDEDYDHDGETDEEDDDENDLGEEEEEEDDDDDDLDDEKADLQKADRDYIVDESLDDDANRAN